MEIGHQYELQITTWDDWWTRFQPEPPVIVSYAGTVENAELHLKGIVDHRFRIVSGAITDKETGKDLSELCVWRASDGPALRHLSGVKLGSGELALGRALLVDPAEQVRES